MKIFVSYKIDSILKITYIYLALTLSIRTFPYDSVIAVINIFGRLAKI